jgi:hypothetical protein
MELFLTNYFLITDLTNQFFYKLVLFLVLFIICELILLCLINFVTLSI